MDTTPINFEAIQQNLGTNAKFTTTTKITDIISSFLPVVFMFAGLGLLLYFLAGGFKLMTAGGDTKKMQEGQQTLTNALLGFVVIFFAYWIVSLLGVALNLPLVRNIF